MGGLANTARIADPAHRAKINREVRDAVAMVIHDRDVTALAVELAVEIVKAIAHHKIPHVRIEYGR